MLLKKQHKPFLSARQVAERIGGISVQAVRNRKGLCAGLTRYPLTWRMVNGVNQPALIGYDVDQVDALIAKIREETDRQNRRCQEQHNKNLFLVGGGA